MEVDSVSFYPLFLDILTDISEAHFVAFDLELSGVASKQAGTGGNAAPGRPTLQQRYLETKEAADRYQILQIGLTCVEQDVKNGKYILKPYNFNLSPLIAEHGLNIERIFSFQSGAVEFLLKAGFDLSRPFHRGVPYLSRAESREARERHTERQDRDAIADIQLKATDIESLAFVERVRGEINAWVSSTRRDVADYVNIGVVGAETIRGGEAPKELTRFEKRLVHQLVRAEFPQLISLGKRSFVQVIRLDQQRENRIAADRTRELDARLNRQKGFRWIVEALLGSNITAIDLRECARHPVTGSAVFADMDLFKAQFHRAQALLRGNPKVLVGHNCFLDLVYIYRTFIGTLPDTVEQFQDKIHRLWPMVIDTKYMSTHNCGDINPVSSLEQIAEQLGKQQTPVLEVDPDHKKYDKVQAFHEAGYDSFLTAQVGIRLSAKLEKEGAYIEVNGLSTNSHDNARDGIAAKPDGPELTEHALFSHDAHNATTDANGFTPSVEGERWKGRGDPTLPPPAADDVFTYNPRTVAHRHREDRSKTFENGMPCHDSDFWRVYGNKLRVFGTAEGVCLLDPRDDPISLGDEDDGGVLLSVL